MKTLFISCTRPYPPLSGAPLRAWHNIRVLTACGPVSVFSFGERYDGVEQMPGVERWIHINEDEYPKRALSGYSRIKKLLRPRQFPLPNDHITGELNRRLRRFIDDTAPDLIVLSGWRDAIPDAVRGFPSIVVDTHNIESLLQEDLLRGKRFLGLADRLQLLRFRRRERKLLREAARIWVCSRDDAVALKRIDSQLSQPVIWPNVIDLDSYADVRSGALPAPEGLPTSSPTIVYIGYYHYTPNRIAAEELIERIFPRVVARQSDARLVLVGRKPTERMREAAARDKRITVTGGVADIRPYLRIASVCAVPLTAGGGTRLKILEAFAAGIPVVSTSKGAEGIAAVDGREIVIADSPDAMADAIIDILRYPSKYHSHVTAALQLVQANYSLDALRNRLPEALPPLEHGAALVYEPLVRAT